MQYDDTIETKHKFYGTRMAKEWVEVKTRNNFFNDPITITYNYGDNRQHVDIPREMAFTLAQALTMSIPKLKKDQHNG